MPVHHWNRAGMNHKKWTLVSTKPCRDCGAMIDLYRTDKGSYIAYNVATWAGAAALQQEAVAHYTTCTKQKPEPDFTKDERVAACREITAQWPYHRTSLLMASDGDSLENIAVYLQMQNTRLRSQLIATTPSSHKAVSK